jgi:hypothetical protein
MIENPHRRVRRGSTPAATLEPDGLSLEDEIATRVGRLLGDGRNRARCRVTGDGPHLHVEIAGPPVDEAVRRAIGVRVLDAVHAMGRTYGEVDVLYASQFPARPEKETTMKARTGDRMIIRGHHVGEPDHDGEILEVRGRDGGPPYRVRWADTGHETLFFPGSDAEIQHFEHLDRDHHG